MLYALTCSVQFASVVVSLQMNSNIFFKWIPCHDLESCHVGVRLVLASASRDAGGIFLTAVWFHSAMCFISSIWERHGNQPAMLRNISLTPEKLNVPSQQQFWRGNPPANTKTGWWFQRFFIFIPTGGNDPI